MCLVWEAGGGGEGFKKGDVGGRVNVVGSESFHYAFSLCVCSAYGEFCSLRSPYSPSILYSKFDVRWDIKGFLLEWV